MSEMASVVQALINTKGFDVTEQLTKIPMGMIIFISLASLGVAGIAYVTYEMIIYSIMKFFSKRFLPDFQKDYESSHYVNIFRDNFMLAQYIFLVFPAFYSLYLPYMLLCSLIVDRKKYFKTVSFVAISAITSIEIVLILACIIIKYFS